VRNVAIEVLAANARWVRGITCIGVALDESAFLPSNEDAANSDASLMDALQPTLATTGGPMLLTSSPATTVGIVHELWEEFYGKAGADVLVVQAGTRDLNPTVRQSVIDKARARDSRTADREFGGKFIEPVAAYIDRETVMARALTGAWSSASRWRAFNILRLRTRPPVMGRTHSRSR
jgi:hypothetical protein